VKRKLGAFTSLRFISPACVPFPLPTLSVLSLHFLQRFIVLCPVFIMARRLLSTQTLSSLLSDIRISHARQYTAAAAEAMRSSGAAGREFPEVSKAGRGGGNNKGTVFWMRDPATGNWIPEDHFGETDTAELRQKLLSSRK
ncbi:hypothetical protein NBB46_24165, partial [Salmonella sp. NW1183]|uniref:hypothetical protein n=1 Tax=Salmonella sp. NW1183 TaxID=2947620 RepID=UPI003F46A1EE